MHYRLYARRAHFRARMRVRYGNAPGREIGRGRAPEQHFLLWAEGLYRKGVATLLRGGRWASVHLVAAVRRPVHYTCQCGGVLLPAAPAQARHRFLDAGDGHFGRPAMPHYGTRHSCNQAKPAWAAVRIDGANSHLRGVTRSMAAFSGRANGCLQCEPPILPVWTYIIAGAVCLVVTRRSAGERWRHGGRRQSGIAARHAPPCTTTLLPPLRAPPRLSRHRRWPFERCSRPTANNAYSNVGHRQAMLRGKHLLPLDATVCRPLYDRTRNSIWFIMNAAFAWRRVSRTLDANINLNANLKILAPHFFRRCNVIPMTTRDDAARRRLPATADLHHLANIFC